MTHQWLHKRSLVFGFTGILSMVFGAGVALLGASGAAPLPGITIGLIFFIHGIATFGVAGAYGCASIIVKKQQERFADLEQRIAELEQQTPVDPDTRVQRFSPP